MKTTMIAAALACGLLLGGCATTGTTHRPIVDSDDPEKYEADLAACQELATQRRTINDEAKIDTGIAAAVGGVIGAVHEGLPGLLGGAAAGAVGGVVQGSRGAVSARKSIINRCMVGRGHRVLEGGWHGGHGPYHVVASAWPLLMWP